MVINSEEKLKEVLNGVHDNVNDLLSLTDYCESVVMGYNDFKIKNRISVEDISALVTAFEYARVSAQSLYEAVASAISFVSAVDGDLVNVKSSPMSFGDKSIRIALKNSDSGLDLVNAVKESEKIINKKVDNLLTKAENNTDVKAFYKNYISEGLVSRVNNILSLTKEGLKGLGDCAKIIKPVEQKYFEK